MLAGFEPPSDDDGYVSPDFNLPDLTSEDEDMAPPPKRSKNEAGFNGRSKNLTNLEDEEELALRLLGRS